jgi:hypothetical protein
MESDTAVVEDLAERVAALEVAAADLSHRVEQMTTVEAILARADALHPRSRHLSVVR